MKFRNMCLSATLCAFGSCGASQQPFNNDEIIKMVKAGLSDDLIIATINARPGVYDISGDGLVAFKASGASDKLLAAVIAKSTPPVAPSPTPGTSSSVTTPNAEFVADPDDPMSKHDVGVYLVKMDHQGQRRMIFVDRAGEAGVKTANLAGAAFSYGIATAKLKAEIPGSQAPVRATDARPVVYMYFPGDEQPRELWWHRNDLKSEPVHAHAPRS